MIKKLNLQDQELTIETRKVFQASYAIEAEILKAVDFPPLKRTLMEYSETETDFYGYYTQHTLSAVVEIKIDDDSIHIQSLVVDPQFFRLGIAGKLLDYVFAHFTTDVFTVETGLDNLPAVRLYKKFGFVESKQYDTDHGIRKIRFEKF